VATDWADTFDSKPTIDAFLVEFVEALDSSINNLPPINLPELLTKFEITHAHNTVLALTFLVGENAGRHPTYGLLAKAIVFFFFLLNIVIIFFLIGVIVNVLAVNSDRLSLLELEVRSLKTIVDIDVDIEIIVEVGHDAVHLGHAFSEHTIGAKYFYE
jgi:hypothetical protein